MTIILWPRFTVGRLTQTPIKYIFSESLIIVHYEGIFIDIKNVRLSEYGALFPKVQRFTNQVRFRSDLIGRTRSTSLCLLDTFLLKNDVGKFLLLVWFVSDTQLNFES